MRGETNENNDLKKHVMLQTVTTKIIKTVVHSNKPCDVQSNKDMKWRSEKTIKYKKSLKNKIHRI